MTQDEQNFQGLVARVDRLEGQLAALERRLGDAGNVTIATATTKKLSAKEFLMTKNVGSEVQRVVALAFYLERQEGMASFNVADLENVFRAAREKLPKNMNDAVNKNIGRGFLMEAAEKKDSKKSWQLTASGERFVEVDMQQK